MTMINPEPLDDEQADIVDLDRGAPADCARIARTLAGPERQLRGALARINDRPASR